MGMSESIVQRGVTRLVLELSVGTAGLAEIASGIGRKCKR